MIKKESTIRLVALTVFANGLLITFNSLVTHVVLRRQFWESRIQINLGIFIGITLIYLSFLLARRKRTAWIVSILIYAFALGSNLMIVLLHRPGSYVDIWSVVRTLAVPLFVVGVLYVNHDKFYVRSDIQNLTLVLRRVIVILSVAFLFGVIGFELLDSRDFHIELTIWRCILYTIDQFGIFTKDPLMAQTYRAKVFLDSLSLISGLSLIYAFIALFQPIRARLSDQSSARTQAQKILDKYGGNSEDFFKLWPHDKSYIFSDDQQAVIAFHVTRGVALAVGSSVGAKASQTEAAQKFYDLCQLNDWLPSFVHIEDKDNKFYLENNFTVQKIGEEAVVELDHFLHHQAKDKYFRQILNKFNKQKYQTEILHPPHDQKLLDRLNQISSDWLAKPGREERGLMMGYHNDQYMNQVALMVARDENGEIQAFVNQVPSYDPSEANFDMIRYSDSAPGNCNDYLLINFMQYLHSQGFKKFNMGLCPLAGVGDEDHDEPGVLDNVLHFIYTNGDRIYSFSGLHRFKNKYSPIWRDRYIAYQGGIRGLTRTVRALNKAMKR